VVVAQLVGVGIFFLPNQVQVSSLRHVVLCEPIFSKFLTLLCSSDFEGDYYGCSEVHAMNQKYVSLNLLSKVMHTDS
jgi:hypothetical protein